MPATRRSSGRWARPRTRRCSCRTSPRPRHSSSRRTQRSPTSRRPRSRSTRRRRSSASSAAASPRSTRRRRRTSATRPPTGSGRSRRCSPEIDLLLVIGSRNSSNSNRLVDVARAGVASHLIDDETEIDEAWLDGVTTVGVTSGASAPEKLVDRVCDWFRARRGRRSSRTGWSTRTSRSACRSSCAASSRSPRVAVLDYAR